MTTTKYDDATWHSGGDFPDDLPEEAAATHSGMFFAWAVRRGLAGDIHLEDFADDLARLRAREVTPGQHFLAMDGKLTDEDFNDVGNRFAQAYYDFEAGKYLEDYETLFATELPSLFHVADSWENFDLLAPVLDRRFQAWSGEAA